jgi:23S rRNA (adenine2503-C2)-methyltransferase
MKIKDVLYLPSGRIFLHEVDSFAKNYIIESTEMRDVAVDGKLHLEVRESTDPKVIWKHLVPYAKKWLLTVSTQFGCSFSCKFCDVATLPFKGNLAQSQIEDQIKNILIASPYVTESSKVKIGFARMGEPAFNLNNVIGAMKNLNNISEDLGRDFTWLPCFNSVLPSKSPCLEEIIDLKETFFGGNLHLQISCNSTSESTRHNLFNCKEVISLDDVIKTVNKSSITNRTVTLNFIVMEGVEVSTKKLMDMNLNPDKFTVKLIPLNITNNAQNNCLKTVANYANYNKLLQLKEEFEMLGIPIVVDAIAKCEEAGLCCGQIAQTYL